MTPRPRERETGPLRLALPDEAATAALGARLAAALGPGDAATLAGPLGAGKSALARAAIRAALARPDLEVPSPSYTLVNVYAGDGVEIWHADLYRLGEPEEALELGLEDRGAALLLLEWPERMGPFLPPRRLEIVLAVAGETARLAEIHAHGPGWERALAELAR